MLEANVDLIGMNGQTQGSFVNQILNNGRMDVGLKRPFIENGKIWCAIYKGGDPESEDSYQVVPSPNPININATLRRDEWKQLDDAVVDVARYRLGGIDDLIANGLTYNLGNALGTTVLEWHDVSDALTAELTMDGITRGKNDQVNWQTNYLPIPIIHVDYEIQARLLAASRNMGNPLDTTLAERAARRVQEKLENMLFTDTTYAFGTKDDRDRNKIYSYLNHPDRNLVNLSIAWDASATTGAMILQDVQDMIQAAVTAYHHGPYMLYIPTAYQRILDDDYTTYYSGTTRSRILQLAGIKGIKVIDTLPANNVLLVEMNKGTVRLVQGMGLTNVQYGQEADMIYKFKVMTIQVPQIRSDQNGKCGVVHLA
jgi:hypothetical protein